ncbi:UvrD-helicase domain-containing protein [endosymbiont of Sipalinus gigas]|uniref:UvrD-helicase domain-containing protein n=1 Tax=endosymbiont of Sipalinus gigas TaxID=1972134 RepID=UPI00102E567D|nr:UvrD-helicase domain-containing protein [endosymbiont of Sipalinus gigas]
MKYISYFLNLNKNQKNIVLSKDKNIVVIAGAGSGKTKILIYRIIWLINKKKINPNSIMIVTFSNKAVNEIKYRIKNILSDKYNNIIIGTFHSILYRMLKIHYKEAGLKNNFQIIDDNYQLRIIKNIIKSLKLKNKLNIEKILKYINISKNKGIRINENYKNLYEENFIFKKIYILYQSECNKLNIIDFSEILIRTYELLNKNINILNLYKKKITNILIDEFQDTNEIQYLIIKLLLHNNDINIMIVGDSDQLIYEWRGAKIENL